MRFVVRIFSVVLLLSVFAAQAAGEEIVFGTAPTHSEEETLRLYSPLMNYLSRATGKKFVISPAKNFVEYSVQMRKGKYDLIFDGPHLTGWRMDELNYTPVARFPGTIRIVVAARKDSDLKAMKDLEGGYARVCAFASPNMLTMAFLSYYDNPVRQPNLIRTQGFKDLFGCLKSGKGQAAVMRDKLWGKMGDEEKADFTLIGSPKRGYPERTFSVSSKVSPELRKQITEALLSEEGKKGGKGVLARFKKKNFIPVKAEDYTGLGKLLSQVWGFHTD